MLKINWLFKWYNFLSNLSGCKEIPEEKEENGRIYHDENGTENLFWKPTGNSKDFESGEHFIYTIVSIQYKNNGKINIPEGYEYVSSENLFFITKYNYVNKVEVNALQYENTKTKKRSYPFPGTPITFQKTR